MKEEKTGEVKETIKKQDDLSSEDVRKNAEPKKKSLAENMKLDELADKKSKPKKAKSEKKADVEVASKKSHKKLMTGFLIGGGVLLIVAILVAVLMFKKEPDITSAKIMSLLEKRIPMVTDVVNYSEANDPNGIMGQENQYTSKSSWEDKRLTNIISEHAGTIEVFKNTKDAELREWKINTTAEACKKIVTAEKYGSAVMSGWNCDDYHMYRVNTVLVRLSVSLNEAQLTEYKNALTDIIERFEVPNVDVPSAERITELRKQVEEDLDSTLKTQEQNLQKSLDELVVSYSQRLDGIMESLDENELKNAKDELSVFKEGYYFAPKIAELEQKLNAIQAKIDEKNRLAEEAAAQAEADKLASKNKRLGSGKYEACVDVDSGTYDVKAVSGNGNLYVRSSNYSHYVNELMSATGAYGWNTEYKNMTLYCGDTLEIKNGLTVQLTAKR